MGSNKPRGINAGRKLRIKRRLNRWADKGYKKAHQTAKWRKPFGGASHASGIVVEKVGIEMRTKDLQVFFGGAKKADWDVGLAVDAITAAPKLDTVVLVTGDGDFIPLVEYLQLNEGCQVEVISFGKSSSGKLKEAAHAFTDMCEDPKRFTIGSRGH